MSVQSEEALNQGVVFLIHLSWLVSFYELNSICSEWPRTATMYHHINVAQIIHTTYSINTIEAVNANTQNSRKTHTNTKQVKLPHEELLSNAMKHRTDLERHSLRCIWPGVQLWNKSVAGQECHTALL